LGKSIFGGLLAGVVINAFEFVWNDMFLQHEWIGN
jgi:hypothetical protein